MMAQTDSRLSHVLSLVDDLFDGRQAKGYRLALQLGTSGLIAAVWDDVYNKMLAFERFSFQKVYNANLLAGLGSAAIGQSAILSYPYKKVSLAIVNSKSTLVPNALFDSDKKEALLKFNHPLEEGESTAIDNLSNLGAKNIYALPKAIEQQFRELYPTLSLMHCSSPLIERVLLINKNTNTTHVVINVQSDKFEIILVNAGKLLFFNTFTFRAPADFIYYVLFVFEQLKLNTETANVELMGDVDKNSEVFQLLYKYIRPIKFASRPDNFDYSFKIAALPSHQYYNLFSQFLFD